MELCQRALRCLLVCPVIAQMGASLYVQHARGNVVFEWLPIHKYELPQIILDLAVFPKNVFCEVTGNILDTWGEKKSYTVSQK